MPAALASGLLLCTPMLIAGNFPPAPASQRIAPSLRSPASKAVFVENKGQWDAQAQFLARTGGVDLWITDRGAVMDFHQIQRPNTMLITPSDRAAAVKASRRQGHVVRMEFAGGKPSSVREGEPLGGVHNYLLGRVRSKWVTGARLFSEVTSEQIYDGISARWYFEGGAPRYDLVVSPGADTSQIGMRYEGASSVAVKNGVLRLGTSLGDVEQRGLLAYQELGDGRQIVQCEMVASGNLVKFHLGAYDKTRPLVIDPLIWCSLSGGSGDETAYAIAVNPGGHAFFGGQTASANFPTTVGAYDLAKGGATDAFVSRLSADGTTLMFSTFLGGSLDDDIHDLVLDGSDNIYVVGSTTSTNFPMAGLTIDTTANGNSDAFVTKLNPGGTALIFSTYLGGGFDDYGSGIVVNGAGIATVVGQANSTTFPTTAGAYDLTVNGPSDAFVTRMNTVSPALVYSTYFGGENDDYAAMVSLASNGDAVFCGSTTSGFQFPITGLAFRTTPSGMTDGYLARLSDAGNSLVFSTFLGGANHDWVTDISFDITEKPTVTGRTDSPNFPITIGAYDQSPNGTDAFVTQLSANGQSAAYSTYIGGTGFDFGNALFVDPSGNTTVAGITTATDFPSTAGGFDQIYNGGIWDAFVTKLNAVGDTALYSTFLGGTGKETPYSVVRDPTGGFQIAGDTDSNPFPATGGAYDTTSNGLLDAFVAKMTDTASVLTMSPLSVTGGFDTTGTVTLPAPAPAGGAVVTMGSNTAKIKVPQYVIVPGGATTKAFSIRTYSVGAKRDGVVIASYQGVGSGLALELKPGGLQGVSVNPNPSPDSSTATGTVTLTGKAPLAGRTVVLTSSFSGMHVPATVVVPNKQLSKTFDVNLDPVGAQVVATITASLGNDKRTVTVTINP